MQVATRSPNEEEILARRSFLGALAGASLGVLSEGIFTEFAEAQDPSSADQISLETSQVEVSGNTIFLRRYGKGPAILLVHGFPRTSLMWRFLAPKLAENHTVVCVDLRAYGRSGIPASTDDHFPYSKHAMAKELIEVMDKLGFPTFTLIGHDRGGHVSYRPALDHPKSVERLAVFDVIPILETWNRSDARFAQTYWPWILLSQKKTLPESYLLGAPMPFSITPSAKVLSARRFLKNMFKPIAIGRASMESARNIEPPRRSTWNTIVRTKKLRSKSSARCCTYGPRVVRSTLSTQKMEGHWAFGGNGLHARMVRR